MPGLTLASRWRQDARSMLAELVPDERPREAALALLHTLAGASRTVSDANERLLLLTDEASRHARRLGWWSTFAPGRRALESQVEGLLGDAQRTGEETRQELQRAQAVREALQAHLQALRQHGAELQLRCDIAATLVADSLASRRLQEQLGADWALLLERLEDSREAEAALRLTAAQCSAAEAETAMLQDRFDDIQAVLQPLLQQGLGARKAA